MRPLIATESWAMVVFGATLLGLLVMLAADSGHRPAAGDTVRDEGSGVVFTACWIVALAVSAGAASKLRSTTLPRMPAFAAGLVVTSLGVSWNRWAKRSLGRWYAPVVTIRQGQAIAEQGPYRWVRHPMYSGVVAIFLGLGLMFGTWVSLTACVFLPLVGLVRRIDVEERALAEAFGDAYGQFAARRKRLIPGVW